MHNLQCTNTLNYSSQKIPVTSIIEFSNRYDKQQYLSLHKSSDRKYSIPGLLVHLQDTLLWSIGVHVLSCGVLESSVVFALEGNVLTSFSIIAF